MFSNFKNLIAEKIISLVENSHKKNKNKLWENFISNPNIKIHESFIKKETNIFKGNGVLYGDISIGEGFSLRDYCNILVYPKAKLTIGKRVFFNNFCSVNCLENIEIGDDTLFGEGVKLYDHNHLIIKDTNINVSKDQFSTAPIIIGKNCWLGSNVVVLKGVTIGNNCIVGANCIIHKSIPDNTIVKNNQNLILETLV
ncbi:acyltransferase [Chryseobacterium sp. C-71]|uniref:acyltransferase n=1 Tax=Chryseobacterium sp. C-71 TaxID=2893882 RepID=UPI001E3B1950|nr:acyltransferase [Chryseobacterium sp. C-71]UFH30871.1 acyltransferase [Chryseobacterium sp. C-71]